MVRPIFWGCMGFLEARLICKVHGTALRLAARRDVELDIRQRFCQFRRWRQRFQCGFLCTAVRRDIKLTIADIGMFEAEQDVGDGVSLTTDTLLRDRKSVV